MTSNSTEDFVEELSIEKWIILSLRVNDTSLGLSVNASSLGLGNYQPPEPEILPYFGNEFETMKMNYLQVHGWLSLFVCIFGIFANILNIIVLSRKDMISPTNAILTGLAVADMLVMLSYLPYTIHSYIITDMTEEYKYNYGWTLFTLIHAHWTVVFHSCSIWLTVTLAIWRFLAVSFPANSKKWCSMSRAKLAIIATYVNSAIFCLPVYITFTIKEYTVKMDDNGHPIKPFTAYKVDFSEIASQNDKFLEKTNFWIFSVILKLVPCIALTGLSLGLIRVLYEANARKQRLKNRVDGDKNCDRTTKMLLAILLLFLLTEFPSGILALLSGILGKDFFHNVYMNFGEMMDILALINSAINFILYCSMSRQFRDTFRKLFTPKILSNWIAVPTEPTTTVTTCV